jgi:16S rRNA (guanine527-N7)-methyltransferase
MDVAANIAEGLEAMGIATDPSTCRALAHHLELVFEANERFNLTSIREADAVALHVFDSCAAVPYLERSPAGAFADIGSGSGFPGVPLALLTGRRVTLVESVGKKARFLESVVEALCLKATVQPFRAEEVAQLHPAGFSAVTARALSALPSLVELASPLLALGGWLICLKGAPEEEELRRGDVAARVCGLRRLGTDPVRVPGVEGRRTVITYERVGSASIRLPRRNGMAQRAPLA